MLLEDMQTYIQSFLFKIPVYAGNMPAKPDTCMALFEYAGISGGEGTRAPGLQLLLRTAPGKFAESYKTFQMIARKMEKTGDEHGEYPEGIKINGTMYFRIYSPTSGCNQLGKDENGNHLISKNFYVVMEEE